MPEVTQAENEVGREHGRPRTGDDRQEGRGTGVATQEGLVLEPTKEKALEEQLQVDTGLHSVQGVWVAAGT